MTVGTLIGAAVVMLGVVVLYLLGKVLVNIFLFLFIWIRHNKARKEFNKNFDRSMRRL